MSGHAERRWRWRVSRWAPKMAVLLFVAGALVACLAVAAPASASHCNPDADPNCQPHDPDGPGPDQPLPDCPLGGASLYIGDGGYPLFLPTVEGDNCVSGPGASFLYEGAAADADRALTNCRVALEGATPPSADGSGRVQFRVSSLCDRVLKRVTLDARLLDARGTQVGAAATQSDCHIFVHAPDCGLRYESTRGEVTGLPAGEYVVEAQVRLVLNEPGAPDPWVTTPGTAPADSNPAEKDTRGICAMGALVVRCNLSLPITVNEGAVVLPRTPATPAVPCFGIVCY